MSLFSDEEQQQVQKAIENAERHTSGEIRVCVEKTCNEDVLARAAKYFHKLDMHQTRHRNGVLIYLATVDRKFAIIGDKGIDAVVPPNFWDSTKELMLQHFKQGALVEGLTLGLCLAGEQMAKYFPGEESKTNELSDDIAFMDGE
ncbi:TPM domain-containing protein [Mucilaginibacter sp. HMF5004]|uniref:TPM domain-containing protein n=1 Tax=Mucilaginibacter rivuli TaxID=2857527 RepID=UPI001C5D246C|nr:TPM domain-containing protein [Mucilaginibacter rivuli]MBW4890903.1 TPM domain-containing protein [Mucilaginibacter rivuli]